MKGTIEKGRKNVMLRSQFPYGSKQYSPHHSASDANGRRNAVCIPNLPLGATSGTQKKKGGKGYMAEMDHRPSHNNKKFANTFERSNFFLICQLTV